MSRITRMAGHSASLTMLLLGVALIVTACSTTTQDAPPRVGSPVGEEPDGEAGRAESQGDFRASPYATLFEAAEEALDSGNWMAAQLAMPRSADARVDPEFAAYEHFVRARIAWQRGDLDDMSDHLEGLPGPMLSDELALKVMTLQRRRAHLEARHLEDARLSIDMLERLPPDHPEFDSIARDTWHALRRSDANRLKNTAARSDIESGWLSATQLASSGGPLAEWRSRYPDHPADRFLSTPSGTRTTSRVALLLPLGGRIADAAAAVRNGFVERYFEERSAGSVDWDLIVLDTAAYPSSREAYNAAIDSGAQLVVGPLTKAAVTDLLTSGTLPVPVIALNRTEAEVPGDETSLQFALAPEDEAAQVAELAFADGHRRALLVRPAGEWGDKMARALTQSWRGLGGDIAATATFSSRETHSPSLTAALGLDASRERATALRRQLGQPIETSGRRRQDIDAVLLLAPSAADARSLMPLLAYHYSGSLPAYATSSANSEENSREESDLNGLNLLEMPGILDRSRVAGTRKLRGDDYARLIALGADACRLAVEGPGARPAGDPVLQGETGFLSINGQRQIERDLQPAVFDRGVLRRR